MIRLGIAWLSCLTLGTAPAQDPGGSPAVVARYLLFGEPGLVSRDDLGLELCVRFRGTSQGEKAIKFLVDCELIRSSAVSEGVMPTPTQTRTWITKLRQRLESAGVSLEQMMAQKGMSAPEFESFAALQIAHERLVRRALDLDGEESVSSSMLELWLREARSTQDVITDGEMLPVGVVARVGDRKLTELDLGVALVRSSAVDRRHKFIRQIVLRRWLAASANRMGITISRSERAAEVARRREEAENDPKYQGVPFEQILKAQGTSLAAMHDSPVLLAQLQERKLIDRLLPTQEMRRRIDEDPQAVARRHGARRRISVILTMVGEGRDRDAALETSEQIRERITREIPFAEAARTYSDDPYTKVAGGDTGWHNSEGSTLPSALVEACFAEDAGWLSPPIETGSGFYLAQLMAIEPAPTEAMLMIRMRQHFQAEERRRMLAEAQVQFTDGP